MEEKPILGELLELLNTVNRINRSLVQREGRGEPRSLSGIQLHALISLRHHGEMNMSELAEHLLVTRPQMTKVIDALVDQGLIARTQNPESRREVLLRMTDEGERFVQEKLLGESSLLARVLSTAGEEELEELRHAVRTMRRIFAKAAVD